MSEPTIDVWNIIQSATTIAFFAFFPFLILLLFQIRHEMASDERMFRIRKMSLVACLTSQLAISTFLRDQFIWNENVYDKDEAPNAYLCGLSRYHYSSLMSTNSIFSTHIIRFLSYGIIEPLTYYLIILLIWDETEAQNISQHQLNDKMVQNIKQKSGDHRFHISTVFKIYCFFVAAISTVPSSMMPSLISYEFVTGIDSNYRCEISNICNILSVVNKIIFFLFIIRSSLKLRQVETRWYKSNLISLIVIVCVYIPCNIFAICNENWLNVLSFDDARKLGYISSVLFTVFGIFNHIMMQAQAKKLVVSGVRRASLLVVRASMAARRSILKSIGGGNNKIGVDQNDQKNRFSIPEITEDEYDSIHIKQSGNKKEFILNSVLNITDDSDDDSEKVKGDDEVDNDKKQGVIVPNEENLQQAAEVDKDSEIHHEISEKAED